MSVTWVKTDYVPLGDLTPFPGNARRGDVEKIRESIARLGQYRSLVVRDTGKGLVILAGNHTHQALAADGAEVVRCEIIRCDDDEAKRINLVDNRAAELGGYDDDTLAELLSSLEGDFEGTGFTEDDLNRLVDGAVPTGEDETEEPLHTADLLANTPDSYKEQYAVMVVCADEDEQERVFEQLQGEGLNVRVVTT